MLETIETRRGTASLAEAIRLPPPLFARDGIVAALGTSRDVTPDIRQGGRVRPAATPHLTAGVAPGSRVAQATACRGLAAGPGPVA